MFENWWLKHCIHTATKDKNCCKQNSGWAALPVWSRTPFWSHTEPLWLSNIPKRRSEDTKRKGHPRACAGSAMFPPTLLFTACFKFIIESLVGECVLYVQLVNLNTLLKPLKSKLCISLSQECTCINLVIYKMYKMFRLDSELLDL